MGTKDKNSRPEWPSGVLTDAVITKDVKRSALPLAIVYSVAAVVLGITSWPTISVATDITLKVAALLIGIGILIFFAYQQWQKALTPLKYRIEEDRIVSKQMQTIYENRDAELTGMATRVAVLELEKHGTYRVDESQIHSGYRAYEIFHLLEEGEGVYIIYSARTNKLLRIYRQKYWTLPQ